MADLVSLIEGHYPCPPGREWLAEQHDPAQAWHDCPVGHWLLWYIEEVIAPPVGSELWKKMILAICACARTALEFIPDGDDRPRKAIEAAEKFARGECDRDELGNAYVVAAAYAEIAFVKARHYAAHHADIVREFFPEVLLPAECVEVSESVATHCARCGNSLRDDNESGLCWECEHE